ncbi:MAG TPA: hypothetical protein VGN72_19840 [Tepidisphaeraceae bacterium]|nr:hypothetical protein [Tepidisphaeraceae bacterium]
MRNWLPGKHGEPPKNDPSEDLRQLCRRMSDADLVDFLQLLSAGRVSIAPVDHSELPSVVRPEHLRDASMAVTERAVAYQAEINKALGDNLIDVDESHRIFASGLSLSKAKLWLSRLTERCSVARRVG